jgi:hypothetical protein
MSLECPKHFEELKAIEEKDRQIDYLTTLPFIGPVTKYPWLET